ncbi:PepSY-like domain-containing protein [Campylobacter canadensis]|uniref:PepSY-like domain-containing protein n=1 Tax=Campylobacter canadensis TaxID=449520 RepID=A0ABS7WTE3_9BACT|nr:PepSY-like domain-containing protein [Campylobacter canadensis]MBZ7987230.1 PepSY-like domain-containing protein [Campylobacter canadensis]MBZ7994308.1 PepSY-like domain-containing protein [Campylobacter canadensis]MBZ7996004.1 PepSY-like domain-containing protein [Campylobacter canadensis]MBZ7998341.1 PepSY-like domain-containing protein [Campylobacter canadensis]MBZ7999640.1 PepSY-like domain-containing protein [Campylobacter canadensis]
MKKFMLGCVLAASLFADTVISPDALPQAAKDFVKTHFSNATIAYAEKDWTSFDVKLSTGAKLEFTSSGKIKEIDTKYSEFPDSILPDILAKAKASQANAKLRKLEKNINGYELKFTNGMEVYINEKGDVIATKFDD